MNTAKILVAIANHGTRNQRHLDQLLAAYRAMPARVDIVVLSNIPKELGPDIEVRVGLPSPNPWSLPFAHRQLFLDRLDDYDYFIYTEDDTLLDWKAVQAFIGSAGVLKDDEIAGFVRTETAPDGARYYSSCHSFFRWIPSSACERGGHLWAHYSNEHAACYVASQRQLRHAIASGGFPWEPHEGRHDMLCAAATDIYTQCGLKRLVCIDRLDEFTLPHLPNKYIGRMGLPSAEMDWQTDALRRIFQGELPDYELFSPETRLPGGIGSKFYREPPDSGIGDMLDGGAKRVLVWGAGDGVFELDLKNQGHDVAVVPMNAVVGESCRRRGLTVLPPDFLQQRAEPRDFDTVILRDVLHLLDRPTGLLEKVRGVLDASGCLIARVPNLHDVRLLKRRFQDARFKMSWSREALGAIPFTPGSLRMLARSAGFGNAVVHADVPASRKKLDTFTFGLFSASLSPCLYLSARV